jgi:hypothetical protein
MTQWMSKQYIVPKTKIGFSSNLTKYNSASEGHTNDSKVL